jgi:hypothetical protein
MKTAELVKKCQDRMKSIRDKIETKRKSKKVYSEEEVRELLIQRCKHFGTSLSPFDKLLLKQDLEWFEKFKK